MPRACGEQMGWIIARHTFWCQGAKLQAGEVWLVPGRFIRLYVKYGLFEPTTAPSTPE